MYKTKEMKCFRVFFINKNAFTFILRTNIGVRTVRPRSLAVIGSHGHLIPSSELETSDVDLRFQGCTSQMASKVII